MGLRFRKSVKICKGARLNFSKRGMGLSLGVKGARYSIGANGRRTVSVGIPGTGIYYSKSHKIGSGTTHKSSNSHTSTARPASKNATVKYSNGPTVMYTPADVQKFNQYIYQLTHIHKECSDPVDWQMLKESQPPFVEGTPGPCEQEASKKYNEAKPSLLEKMKMGNFEKRKQELHNAIEAAHQEDIDALDAWKVSVETAAKVLAGNTAAYCEAVEAADPFVEISRWGSDFEFGTDNPKFIEVEFKTNIDEVAPHEKLELTKTGKVSYKQMSKTEMYDIILDYVCSCAIRVSRELFALLPIEAVIAHAVLDEKDGRGEIVSNTILSVKYERAVFEKTNFASIDASDYTETFLHKMKFLKTQGFRPVERISADMVDVRIAPTINSDSASTINELPKNVKVELPFGWYYHNREFTEPRDKNLAELQERSFGNHSIDERIAALKELMSFYKEYQAECISKGIYFEKYFNDMHGQMNCKSKDVIAEWQSRLDDMEASYLDTKEAEDILAKEGPMLKENVYKLIQENPGIYQKDITNYFHASLSSLVLTHLYELTKEGKVRKEKEGKCNKLYAL